MCFYKKKGMCCRNGALQGRIVKEMRMGENEILLTVRLNFKIIDFSFQDIAYIRYFLSEG